MTELENYQTVTRERAIELLLDKVEEVLWNNWATEEGHQREGETCPIQILIDNIRAGE